MFFEFDLLRSNWMVEVAVSYLAPIRRLLVKLSGIYFRFSRLSLNGRRIAKVVRCVSHAKSLALHVESVSQLGAVQSCCTKRRFWRLDLAMGNGEVFPIFVKADRFSLKRYRIARRISGLGLPVPEYYGDFISAGYRFGVWSYQSGVCFRSFNDFSEAQLAAVAAALAQCNVIGGRAFSRVDLALGPMWSDPISTGIARFMLLPDLQRRMVIIENFCRYERLLLELLNSGENLYLNHNDCKAGSVVLLDSDGVCVTDWDSASLGPLGASLRCFAVLGLERRQFVAQCYVDSLDRLGVAFDCKSALKMMCIQQVFWALATGVRLKDVVRIGRGLDLFARLFSCEGGVLSLHGVGKIGRA